MKLLGAFLIIAAAAYIGTCETKKAKKRLEVLVSANRLCETLLFHIKNSPLPLYEIYSLSAKDNAFAKELEANGGDYAKALVKYDIDSEVCEKLISFGENIGSQLTSKAVSSCEELCAFLSEKAERQKAKNEKTVPLYRSLWLIVGMAAVIILI